MVNMKKHSDFETKKSSMRTSLFSTDKKNQIKLTISLLLLVFLIASPLTLLILPATFFDEGKSLCLSQILLGKSCPACGMTRGIMHLIHLNVEEAFAYNMMSFIVLPLLIVLWFQWVKQLYMKINGMLKAKNPLK